VSGRSAATRDNLGYLLAKASQRWNELIYERFAAAGFPEVRAAYGSVLLPLYEDDGLRMSEIARRARLSKQTLTTMVRLAERDGLVERRVDPDDRRATRVYLSDRARAFRPVAEQVLSELDEQARSLLGDRRLAGLHRALREVGELQPAAPRRAAGRPHRQ
jgi:DNA-binding MarR family transcriptional regulator